MGDRAAKQVVQLYSSQRRPSMPKPAVELRGFAKSRELASGESEMITIRVPLRYFAAYDDAGNRWVVDADTYTLSLGFSSEDLRASRKMRVSSPRYERTSNVMRPEIPLGGTVFIEEPLNTRFPLSR